MTGLAYTVQTTNMDNIMASSGVGVQNWRDKGGGGGRVGLMVPS